MSGLLSATPIAPIGPPKNLSVTGTQVIPASVVLRTPPPVVPHQYSYGRDAEPAAATERPPRMGPISRHFIDAKKPESGGGAVVMTEGGAAARAGGRAPCAAARA